MNQTNQIFFLIFCSITVTLILVIIPQYRMAQTEKPSIYWPASVCLYFISCLSFGLAASLSMALITVANTALVCSVTSLNFLYRSWIKQPFTKAQTFYILGLLIVFTFIFEALRLKEGTFIERVVLTTGSIIFLMTWQCYYLKNLIKERTERVIKWLLVLTIFIITIVTFRSLLIVSTEGSSNLFLDKESGWAFALRWLCFSSYNLIFFALTAYYFEKHLNEKNRINLEFEITKVEKQRIAELLEEKEQLVNRLIKANKSAATGALSASIAHELSQPLTAINANLYTLQYLMQSHNINSRDINQIIESIVADNDRSGDIVKSLGSIFRDEELKLDDTSVDTLISGILKIIEPECKLNKIELSVNSDPNLELRLNENEIKQVLLNLMNNAIFALAQSDIPNRQINILAKKLDGHFILSVSDNGPGVHEQMQDKLFELLQSDKKGGSGLGLWLCRHIAIRHQGSLQFENQYPHGAKFSLTIPLF